jgi:magnesium chelatase subunit H
MRITVFHVGSSLLAPLRNAEREINRAYALNLRISAYNFGAGLSQDEWLEVERDLGEADVVFIIHVMDSENGQRLLAALDRDPARHRAVVVINCMPDLMRRTRMGRLDLGKLLGNATTEEVSPKGAKVQRTSERSRDSRSIRVLTTVGSWIGNQARSHSSKKGHNHTKYLKLVDRLPAMLRFVPNAGMLRDIKNYLYLFCYFLQPTPVNIRAMMLHALKHYGGDERLKKIKIPAPQQKPSLAIYHPDSAKMFESFPAYRQWYARRSKKLAANGNEAKAGRLSSPLEPNATIGLLLMRPQVISKTTKHYDQLIRAIEAEGLSVIPVLATLMDNREACEKFFIEQDENKGVRSQKSEVTRNGAAQNSPLAWKPRVSQILSLTGFSFVGGPAMNDSEAAASFLKDLNLPYRAAVSLDMQTIESWRASRTGLNPVQAGMQIAIPEIDGATEPFVYGGIPAKGVEPVPFEDRCRRLARRLRRWNHLRTAPRKDLRLALVLYCFPPNKGNIGTAADLDVFPSVYETLKQLKADGYTVMLPASAEDLRERMLGGNSEAYGATANVAYRMKTDDYRKLCPYVEQVENDWGAAPGRINSFGGELLVQGIQLGNVFVVIQPTFGYEGDPLRLMMARSGAPHHGFMAFYTYIEKVLEADAVVHVGTHGAMEFMPGKQVGLSGECWPDRLIGELPNIYIYSVNNPSEGSIAKRRSYAELISYLTPPIENAGLYKELASLKDLVMAYREALDDYERDRLFESIEDCARQSNLNVTY